VNVDMMTDPDWLEFLSGSRQALDTDTGNAALDTLGWWDLLNQLDNPEMQLAAFSLFRAHGAALASSTALCGMAAQPFLAVTGHAPGTLLAALPRRTRNGVVGVVVGDPTGKDIAIEQPGGGISVVRAADATLRPIIIPGKLVLHEIEVDEGVPLDADPDTLEAARLRSRFLRRVAGALEMLGSAEQALALAASYAADRQQFGQPIATFQAIRHLLAWARTDCVAIEAVVYRAVRLDRSAPPDYDQIVKVIAGRNGRKAAERTLQVFGGIGFTAEHDHHHFHSRIITLDALDGSAADLAIQIGRRARADHSHINLAGAVLYPSERAR
jgi:Acyl-CoA dehydrogenase, C-terminal domain